jgi:hypothetical protein
VTPAASRPRPRARGPRGATAVATIIGVVLLAVPAADAPSLPDLTLAADGGLIVVRGHSPLPGEVVDVTAELEGGLGSASVEADPTGRFGVSFRPPRGYRGPVEVRAVVDGWRTSSEVVRIPSRSGTRAAATAAPPGVPVPTSGAPASTADVDSGLPRFQVPAGIRADCSRDVTSALNTWLESVPDGSQIDFPGNGCFRVDGSLILEERNRLVVSGGGAVFRAGSRVPTPETNRAQWFLIGGTDLTLRDMTLIGVNQDGGYDPGQEYDHNVFIRGSRDVVVRNVHGRRAHGDFIAIAQGIDQRRIPADIRISRVTADTVGRMGISCVACDGVSVTDSVFHDVALHAFDIEVEGDGRPARGITYSRNTVGRHGWAFVSVGTPFQTVGNDVSDIVISENRMTQPGGAEPDCLPAISFRYSKTPVRDVRILGNDLVSHGDAVLLRGVSTAVVRANRALLLQPTCGHPVGLRTEEVDGLDAGANRWERYAHDRLDG